MRKLISSNKSQIGIKMTLNAQQLVNNQFKCYALTITVRWLLL